MKLRYISTFAMAAAATAAIAAAPTAAAAPTPIGQTCIDAGSSTLCQSPGNAQFNASPPVQYASQYPFYGNALLFHHGGHHR